MNTTEKKLDDRRKLCVLATPEIMAAIRAEQRRAKNATGYGVSMTRVAQRALEQGLGLATAEA
ncbi:hypothetical protein D9M68_1002270 [compost metagenome]